jgi:hypothetical protein
MGKIDALSIEYVKFIDPVDKAQIYFVTNNQIYINKAWDVK